jgi:hypothetical protein
MATQSTVPQSNPRSKSAAIITRRLRAYRSRGLRPKLATVIPFPGRSHRRILESRTVALSELLDFCRRRGISLVVR